MAGSRLGKNYGLGNRRTAHRTRKAALGGRTRPSRRGTKAPKTPPRLGPPRRPAARHRSWGWIFRGSRARARAGASWSGTCRRPRGSLGVLQGSATFLRAEATIRVAEIRRTSMAGGGNFKRNTADIIAELLSDERVRRGLDYVRSDEFKTERHRIRQEAADRLKNVRERYRPKRRTPEIAARERELTLRLAEVEAEAAEVRLRLSERLEQEEKIRAALEDL